MFEKLRQKVKDDYGYTSDVNKHLQNYIWSCGSIIGSVDNIIKNLEFFDLDPDLIKETEEALVKLVGAVPMKRTDAYNYIEKSIASDEKRKSEW